MLTFSRFVTNPRIARNAASVSRPDVGPHLREGEQRHGGQDAEHELEQEHRAPRRRTRRPADDPAADEVEEAEHAVDAEHRHEHPAHLGQDVHLQLAAEGAGGSLDSTMTMARPTPIAETKNRIGSIGEYQSGCSLPGTIR